MKVQQSKFRLLLSTSDGTVLDIQDFTITSCIGEHEFQDHTLLDFDLAIVTMREGIIRYQRSLLGI